MIHFEKELTIKDGKEKTNISNTEICHDMYKVHTHKQHERLMLSKKKDKTDYCLPSIPCA